MSRDTIPTGPGVESPILYQLPMVKLAKEKYPGVKFFVMEKFDSPNRDERYWKIAWDDEVVFFTKDGMSENWFGSQWCNSLVHDIRPATAEQIATFKTKRAEVEAKRKKEDDAESELLALCGLSHDDFVRFRHVSKTGKYLHVTTRENGVGARSMKAIKNANYVDSRPDEDATYEHYRFKLPKQPEKANSSGSASVTEKVTPEEREKLDKQDAIDEAIVERSMEDE